MSKCNCYVNQKVFRNYDPLFGRKEEVVGVCNGTKERDICSCGGDRTKCDFYPEVREKAFKETKEYKTAQLVQLLMKKIDMIHFKDSCPSRYEDRILELANYLVDNIKEN